MSLRIANLTEYLKHGSFISMLEFRCLHLAVSKDYRIAISSKLALIWCDPVINAEWMSAKTNWIAAKAHPMTNCMATNYTESNVCWWWFKWLCCKFWTSTLYKCNSHKYVANYGSCSITLSIDIDYNVKVTDCKL